MRDPVSEGRRLTLLQSALRDAGVERVDLKLYPEARHELFNEINREEVCGDLVTWINQVVTAPA